MRVESHCTPRTSILQNIAPKRNRAQRSEQHHSTRSERIEKIRLEFMKIISELNTNSYEQYINILYVLVHMYAIKATLSMH